MDPSEPPLLPESSDEPTRPTPPEGSGPPGGFAEDWRRSRQGSDPTHPPAAKGSALPPSKIISRVLLVAGLLLMLYVVIVISRALS